MKTNIYWWLLILFPIIVLSACTSGVLPNENQAEVTSIIPPLLETTADQNGLAVLEDEEPPEGEPTSPPDVSFPVDAFSAAVTATGEVIFISGRVLDVNGIPVSGAAVEIWQTDANGVYDHPGDLYTRSRDPGFQFYGTSITDDNGEYRFRTLRPGAYEPRPPHIHVKIKLNGITVLITQLYFSDTGNAGGLGAGADQLIVTLEADISSGGQMVGEFDFVIETGEGDGPLELTPSQAEGPYYPVIDLSVYDNDLVSVE